MSIKTYEDIEVWKRAHQLTLWVYQKTKSFPKHELFGLTSQLQRAGSSVPTNIVEGFYHGSTKELIKFLYISRASLGETLYLIHLSKDLNYISADDFQAGKIEIDIIGRQINAWIKSLKTKL